MRPALLSLPAVAALLIACSDTGSTLPSVEADTASIEFSVRARGEIVASESLPIALPASIRMGFNIAWIAPEFSEVRAGEVIARFDDVQILLDRETSVLEIARAEFQLANSERLSEVELARIGHEIELVDGERYISETFASVDERLLSRNELIDVLADLDYLDVRGDFLDWQADTFDQRIQAEQDLIRAEQQGELAKLEKQDQALEMMELRSPADGTLVYARTPWGDKIGKGKRVFSGRPIGLLPIRGKVRARLYVPENDAVGLLPGQTVRFRLDSAIEREFTGLVETVSPVASPRNRTDPQKFFRVEAAIDNVDTELMRVGSRLRAEIVTGRVAGSIVVPSQAVYGDVDQPHVYVIDGGDSRRRHVELGQRGPDLVEVVDGLLPGDRISLVTPPDTG